jgi:hypothetical protein
LPVRAMGKPSMKNPPRRCRAGGFIENDHLVPIHSQAVNARLCIGGDFFSLRDEPAQRCHHTAVTCG